MFVCVCTAAAGDEAQLMADSASASGKVISLPSNKSYIKVIEKEKETHIVTIIKAENRPHSWKKRNKEMTWTEGRGKVGKGETSYFPPLILLFQHSRQILNFTHFN